MGVSSGVFPFLVMKKIYTIKNNAVFTRMYAKAKSEVRPTVVIYARKNVHLDTVQIGITVSKKLGGAVQRNRARRLVREAWRIIQNENEGLFNTPCYVVLVARSRCFKKNCKMQHVKRDIESGLRALGLLEETKE